EVAVVRMGRALAPAVADRGVLAVVRRLAGRLGAVGGVLRGAAALAVTAAAPAPALGRLAGAAVLAVVLRWLCGGLVRGAILRRCRPGARRGSGLPAAGRGGAGVMAQLRCLEDDERRLEAGRRRGGRRGTGELRRGD